MNYSFLVSLPGSHVFQDPDQLEEWQRRVRQDPMEFLTLCKELLIRPDLNALVEWSNWLTPNSFGYKRFDTIFYMVAVSQTLPFLNDEYEVATVRVNLHTFIINHYYDEIGSHVETDDLF